MLAAQGKRADQISLEEIDWLGRLRQGLEKTRKGFVTQLLDNLGDDPLTPEVLDDLESTLLRADVGSPPPIGCWRPCASASMRRWWIPPRACGF